MPRALKVYCTAIGFHDAYVAAPSQKAALAAWGTSKDLFARGAAELVTQPELTKAPLASPGEVIKLARGDKSDHLAAAKSPVDRPRVAARPGVADEESSPKSNKAKGPPRRKPNRRPSREALARAEAALAAHLVQAEQEIAALAKREEALRQERGRIQARQYDRTRRLETALARIRQRYDAAVERWRAED